MWDQYIGRRRAGSGLFREGRGAEKSTPEGVEKSMLIFEKEKLWKKGSA